MIRSPQNDIGNYSGPYINPKPLYTPSTPEPKAFELFILNEKDFAATISTFSAVLTRNQWIRKSTALTVRPAMKGSWPEILQGLGQA